MAAEYVFFTALLPGLLKIYIHLANCPLRPAGTCKGLKAKIDQEKVTPVNVRQTCEQ